MLPKRSRLGREEFNKIFKRSVRASGLGFTMLYQPSPSLHVSVVVSKKVSLLSSTRNRIRRQIYSLLAGIERENPRGGTYIVLVQPLLKQHPMVSVRQSLRDVRSSLLSRTSHSR